MNRFIFDEFVISTWNPKNYRENDILLELRKFKSKVPNIILTTIPQPLVALDIYNPANLALQVKSTKNGLLSVTKDYVIKCRSDEFFNLKNFVNFYFKNTEKLLFLNYIVREVDYCKFHMSDHLFGGSSEKFEIP